MQKKYQKKEKKDAKEEATFSDVDLLVRSVALIMLDSA